MKGLREVGSRRTQYRPDDGIPQKPSYRCPYCGKETTFSPIAWTYDHWIAECDNGKCKKRFYAKVNYTGYSVSPPNKELNFDVIETYPKYVPTKHESIPEHVWSDYLEACKCFDVRSFKATVVMCRRMMQNVCLDRGAKNKDNKGNWISLKNQLKSAFPTKEYENIHLIADTIKYFGDYGAHPQNDGVDKVTKEDAKQILDFVSPLLDIAYITPWKVNKLKTKKP